MTILEQITQMKSQGVADEEIVGRLQQQGISPKEINDALGQVQIKSAISGSAEMQPSIMQQDPPIPTQEDQGSYIPQSQEMPSEQAMYAPQQQYPSPQEFYQQGTERDYSAGGGLEVDSMIEIAEQVFSQKIKKIQKDMESINEFKTLAQVKIDSSEERLKRIEKTIDRLQISILEKIGSYGKNLESIKKEMSMMQDSFGKVVNQAVRGHKAHTPIIHKTPAHKTPAHTVKKPVAKKTSRKK